MRVTGCLALMGSYATELADPSSGGTLFVQGVSGSVGSLVTQHAIANGLQVVGTASEQTRAFAESLGARVVDYRDRNWPALARELTCGGANASIDHTGSPLVRAVTTRAGTVVRTAWSGRNGHGRIDAARGGTAALARRFPSPRERLCSVPLLIALRPAKYRLMLQDQLNRLADNTLRGPTVMTVPFSNVIDAHAKLATLPPGHKLILEMAAE